MAWIGSVIGGASSIGGGLKSGIAAKQNLQAAGFEADQIEEKAAGEIAAASFNNEEIKKRAERILSANRARAAAGGGDTTDASVMAVQQETVRNATMDQLLAMTQARESARHMRYDAEQVRTTGEVQYSTSRAESASRVATGAATIAGGLYQSGLWGRSGSASQTASASTASAGA